MATVYGVNATKELAKPNNRIGEGDVNGRCHAAFDYYTSPDVIGASDVIELMTIPSGARVTNVKITWTDFGTTGAGTLGWKASADAQESADADGLAPSCDLTSAGQYLSDSAIVTNAGLFKKFAAPVRVTFNMSAVTTAAGTIKVLVEYVLD